MHIKLGTRGSQLALWQAHYVKERLQKAGITVDIVVIETQGDRILDVALSKIGSKGLFTEEIEAQLKKATIDLAVHSAKDLQSTLPEGFEIIALSERESPKDVWVSHRTIDLKDKALVLGTSSTRRLAFQRRYFPHLKTVPVRGNLQTRMEKMKNGACDALWLAYAGVHRMGYDDRMVHELDPRCFVPAVGQGSIAIEAYEIDPQKAAAVRQAINHTPSEVCIITERAFLQAIGGGCSLPVFGLATMRRGIVTLRAGIVSLDGQTMVKKSCKAPAAAAPQAAQDLGAHILHHGGKEILAQLER